MAIQILGADGATTAAVDVTHQAQRISLRPAQVTTWNSYGLATSAVTGLGVGAALLSLRNASTNQVLVRRMQMQWITTTAFTAAQRMEFALYIARTWTSADFGGTSVAAASGKHRASFTAPNIDLKVYQGGAINAGTRTFDAAPVGVCAMYSNIVGATMPQVELISQDPGDHPVLLGANEGLVLTTAIGMGAGGAGIAYVNLELAESTSY